MPVKNIMGENSDVHTEFANLNINGSKNKGELKTIKDIMDSAIPDNMDEKLLIDLVNWISVFRSATNDSLTRAVQYFKVAWKYSDLKANNSTGKTAKRNPTPWNLFVQRESAKLQEKNGHMSPQQRFGELSKLYKEEQLKEVKVANKKTK